MKYEVVKMTYGKALKKYGINVEQMDKYETYDFSGKTPKISSILNNLRRSANRRLYKPTWNICISNQLSRAESWISFSSRWQESSFLFIPHRRHRRTSHNGASAHSNVNIFPIKRTSDHKRISNLLINYKIHS